MKRRSAASVLFAAVLALGLAACPVLATRGEADEVGEPSIAMGAGANMGTVELDSRDDFTIDTWADPIDPATADGDDVSDAAASVKAKVLAAYDSCAESVTFATSENITVADVRAGMALVYADAERYWAASRYSMSYADADGDNVADDTETAYKLKLYYVVDTADIASVKSATEAKIAEALSWVDEDNMSDFQAAQALHDYLVRNCVYDTASASSTVPTTAHTAYGALVEKSAVCQGYALAYKLLLVRAGVPCVFVTSTSMNHAWNMVQVGGDWYHTDVTWDDPVYSDGTDAGFDVDVSHTYFLRADSTMENGLSHYGWEAAYTTPTSDYANRTYVEYKAPVATSSLSSEKTYAHSATATSGGVTFKVEWDDAATSGEATTFHVTQTGGSSVAKARMDVPTYWDNGSQESVCDPTRAAWGTYYEVGDGYDFTFELTASGTYRIYFYFMDTENSVYYLRAVASVEVSDSSRPSVSQIVANAVAQAKQKTDGSEYAMALWLHDWTLDQLEYDYSLNYCSAESGLTRAKGTCESYQRIYAKLLDAAGIANGRVTGNGHTWNAVKIDGKWCQMDLTWDDTDDNWYGDFDQRHIYFGLTDEAMAIAHSDHTANYQADGYAYRSTDLSNNYFVRNGKADEWADAYVARIQTHLDAKETGFSLTADNASYPPTICGIQNSIVAETLSERTWAAADGAAATLAATSTVTTKSSTSWTATYDFTASYLTGYYDVSLYKKGSSSSSWTYPTKDGCAFAGWYTDETCETACTATTGYAYARFVPVSELISFRGCSLRDDFSSSEKTCLRFSYEFSAPAGATRSGMAWSWTNSRNGKAGRTSAKSYWLVDGGSVVANLVFTNLQRSSAGSSYDSPFLVAGVVSYVTADGTSVEATGARVSRTVAEAAQAAASGASASADERAYAKSVYGSDEELPSPTDGFSSVVDRYSVDSYKSTSDSSAWTYPTKDGYAFAGWYKDEACTTAYTATTGYAYARFVPVSELISFRGCSLRDDFSSSEKTCLRFSYEFSAPAGATRSGMAWSWTNSRNGKAGRTSAKSYWLVDGGSVVANLVFTNLQRSSAGSSYDSPFLVAGVVSYVTADGTSVEATGARVSRTVAEAAQAAASGASASADERAYASGIIDN